MSSTAYPHKNNTSMNAKIYGCSEQAHSEGREGLRTAGVSGEATRLRIHAKEEFDIANHT
jgi:hypothetical protein